MWEVFSKAVAYKVKDIVIVGGNPKKNQEFIAVFEVFCY